MANQPLSLAWACFIREHGQDLKISKEARVLALALLTYGAGQRIFASMVTLSGVTGMKRDTVRKARRELQDKGLLEDITGDPAKQERTYRLTVPGYVVPERTTPGPLEDHPVVPERTTPGPREDHNIKPLDLDLDQAADHNITNPDAGLSPTQPQSQNPAQGEWLAGHLGVSPGEIGRNALQLADDLAGEFGQGAVAAAAQRSRQRGERPVGYFFSSARVICEQIIAGEEREEAAEFATARQRELSAEVDAYRARFEEMGHLGRVYFHNVKDWRDAEKTDEEILGRLPGLLERCAAEHAKRLLADERRDVLAEYARRLSPGMRRDYVLEGAQTFAGDQDVYDYMRARLAELPPQDETPTGESPADQRAWLESLRAVHS